MSELNLTATSHQAARQIQSLLQSVSGRGSSITAIDLDGEFLQLAQASRRLGRTMVTRFEVERLVNGELTAKSRGAAIAQCLRKWRLRPDRVVMGIPRASVILRHLSLPLTNSPGEMAAMVHYQISKDLPFRLEDAVVDFKVQPAMLPAPSSNGNGAPREGKLSEPSNPSGPPQVPVLVAIIKKEVLKYHQDLAKTAGFKLAALGLRSYANARCVEACGPGPGERCAALATLSPEEVVVDVQLDHELVFSRVATPHASGEVEEESSPPGGNGSGNVSPQAATMEDAAIEVVRSLHCYEGQENHSQVTRLYLAGTHSQLSTLSHLLQERLNLPVTVLDPIRDFNLSRPDTQPGSGAIAVFGLALGMLDSQGLPFNFLNPKRPSPPGTGRRTRVLAITAAVSIFLCLLVGLRMHLIRQRTRLKASVQQQVNAASQNLSIYRQTITQARTVKSWLADEKPWLDHLTYLCALLPPSPDLYVISLSTGSKGSIHLSVKARHSEVITRLDTRLREAGYEMKPSAITPSGDAYDYPFQATLEITASDKFKIDLAKLQFTSRPEDDGSLDPASRGKARKGLGRRGGAQ